MKAKAVRLHGANDLRIDEFELPAIKDDEMLVKIVADSICMSTHKLTKLGSDHKRVPDNIAEHPPIVGHELAGDIVEVGAKYADLYKPGQKFTIQPNINYKGSMETPGYSYEFCGGDATYCILPQEIFETNCFLAYDGDAYYAAALTEPLSCSVGAMHAMYHTQPNVYSHEMGIKPGGTLAILAGAGPMGLGALTYALHRDNAPRMVLLTDIDQKRLDRAELLFPPAKIKEETGIELHIMNTGVLENPVQEMRDLTDGAGFDDVLAYAPVAAVVEQAADILGRDGCLNFFAGPTDTEFKAPINFYDIHYNMTHVLGTTGGNTDDMIEVLELASANRIDTSVLVTHIGGLNVVPETVYNLPQIPGGKKLIYTHVEMPLVALDELRDHVAEDERFAGLADIVEANNGLWSKEAEDYLLANWAE